MRFLKQQKAMQNTDSQSASIDQGLSSLNVKIYIMLILKHDTAMQINGSDAGSGTPSKAPSTGAYEGRYNVIDRVCVT